MRAASPPSRPPKRLTEVLRGSVGNADELFDAGPGPGLGDLRMPDLEDHSARGRAELFESNRAVALPLMHVSSSSSVPAGDFAPCDGFDWAAPLSLEQSPQDQLQIARLSYELRHLSVADLVAEIAIEEENVKAQQKARVEMEAALRGEVDRLQGEIRLLRREAAVAKQEAERAIAAADTVKHHNQAELKALCRKLDATQRGTQVTRRMAQQTLSFREKAEKAREEFAEHLKAASEKRSLYEGASETLQLLAMRVECMEQEKAELSEEVSEDPTFSQEAKALMTAKANLVKEMNGIRDMMDLKYLLDLERANAEGRRVGNSKLVEEVAELEREGEDLDRTNQQAVASLRCLLERGAAREKELGHSKTKAAEWLKAVWTAMCKQRKDELALFEKVKQDDLMTEHLQQRIDGLIAELRQLETDARAFGTGPDPLPAERELEDSLQRSLAGARQLRRGAHHSLAVHLARHRPLVEALAAAEEEQRHLTRQFRFVRHVAGGHATPAAVAHIG
mmetsp:Transcript_10484/g.29915  ORF Transcript_10484/g.29915 Transcript_10484/m.29915 type:complete len:508 (+) Transcript_10484:97-1620(+)